jgi:PHD/YefM family antitoxin component YafN of YafNO toxin-antitoxin module
VAKQNIPHVLMRNSRPEAALISYQDYLAFQELREKQVLARFDDLMARMAEENADVDEQEVAADVAAARAELDG